MVEIFLSEFIGNEYQVWRGCDDVFIETPTGSGKTTFVLDVLSRYAMERKKEVLMLVNRKVLKRQIKRQLAEEHGIESMPREDLDQIKEFGGITLLSYQELQEELKYKSAPLGTFFADRFAYIVFDEIHYLLEDAPFNRNVEYLIRAIPKRRNATKIFLSATMEEVKTFLLDLLYPNEMRCWYIRDSREKQILGYQRDIFCRGNIFFYSQKPKFRIRSLKYFRNLSEIYEVINEDKSGEKWLVFVNSKNEAGILKNGLKKTYAYLDSEVDEDDPVKQKIVMESKFDENVLITTKVLDNGVNIIDEKLRNIILLTTERTEFLQMIGRKRFKGDEEGINIFIMHRNISYFNARRNGAIKSAQKYIEDIKENPYFQQSRFDDMEFFIFCQKMVIIEGGCLAMSRAAKEKLRLQADFYDLIIMKLKEDSEAFIKEQIAWLGEAYDPSNYLNSIEEKKKKITRFLENISEKKLDKNAQEDFRKRFKELVFEFGVRLTDREERLPGKAKINQFCKDVGLSYKVEAIKNSKFWIIKGGESNEETVLYN